MSYPGRFYPGQVYPSQSDPISSDTATFTESASLIVLVSASDVATTAESRTGNSSIVNTDLASLTETITITANQASSDSATFAEGQSSLNTADQRLGMDSGTFTESSSLIVQVSASDTASQIESMGSTASPTASDMAAETEASRINLGGTDVGSTTDTSYIGQQRSDLATFVESIKNSLSTTDSANLSEVKNMGILASDLFSFTDVKQPSFNYFYTSDYFILVDKAAGDFTFFKYDLFGFIEDAHVTELETKTDEPFIYPTYEHRNDLRVIAQDHFTREIIHWDLPVDNVTLTFTLSGPNLFTAQISSEMESIYTLNPPLTPDRTWLHVEESGQIVASFIMTPIIEDTATQSRSIEGEGFSAYPHWVYYEGASYVGVQIDPSRIIAKLWEHVQSYPDGDLKVTLKGLGTPVRIGYPPDTSGYHAVTGIDVDQNNGGPYLLNFWSAINCGEEIEKLCKENSIEYYERSYWNEYHTDIYHEIVFGYPRVGKRRDDLIFAEGQNLYQLVPSYQESQDNYASDVLVIGAGTGSIAIRAKASARIGRLRRTKVIQNQNIIRNIQAEQIARFELTRLNESRFLIENILVDLTHINTPLGSFQQGDDIYLQCNVPYVGYVQKWYRITSYAYDMYNKVASLSLDPSESFEYGHTRVDPTSYLPVAGFAMVSHQPFLKSVVDAQNPNGYDVIDTVEVTDDAMKVYEANCVYDICIRHNIGEGISPGYAAVTFKTNNNTNVAWKIVPLENTGDGDYKLVIARTEEGGYFVGDNVFFMDNFGNYFGERPDQTKNLTETPLVLNWVAAYANKLIQVWETNPKLIGPGLNFPGSSSTPGALQGVYNHYIFAKVYYGWGGTYSANGPGPELYGIMKSLAGGMIYIY